MRTPGFPNDTLAKVVREALKAPGAQLTFSRTTSGQYSTSYFVSGWDRELVIRIAPPDRREDNLFYEFRMMRQEPEIHSIVRKRTDAPAPKILAHEVMNPVLGRDFLLMERLPGTPVSEKPLTAKPMNAVLGELGRCLAQVHAITRNEFGYVGAHAPMEPQSDWKSAFGIMWNKLIDDIEGCGGYSSDEGSSMRRLLDKHMSVIDRPVKASLLHMDIWTENILCDANGKFTGLLDWDRGLWGDPEIEFAVLEYCDISKPAFWDGYGRRRDDSPEARIRLALYFLYELQKYIFIRRVRSRSPSGAEPYRRQAIALATRLS